MSQRQRRAQAAVGGLVVVALAAMVFAEGRDQVRTVTVSGDAFAFSPARLEVQQDDMVKVTFTAKDLAHSFTIDEYRLMKRAGAGQSVTFEFRADQAGTFRFYCNLTQDERCRGMHGQLVVR